MKRLYQRLISWLYIKAVLGPMLDEINTELGGEYELEFIPADELLAELESRDAVKH